MMTAISTRFFEPGKNSSRALAPVLSARQNPAIGLESLILNQALVTL